MAQLAIKGHKTRGKEVIQLLEMLGGKSNSNVYGYNDDLYYFIAKDGVIYGSDKEYEELACNYSLFTLEEFKERFPYKVGDKVRSRNTINHDIHIVKSMEWNDSTRQIYYTIKNIDGVVSQFKWTSQELIPYKNKKTMEEKLEQIILDIPNGYEFFGINDDNKVVLTKKQLQYPKDYEECCEILDILGNINIEGYKKELLLSLQQLLICRNAYWKIAGEQMGLGKPWEPDWSNGLNKCCLKNCESRIVRCALASSNALLAFPTEEMRNDFFENFKYLINECKELL